MKNEQTTHETLHRAPDHGRARGVLAASALVLLALILVRAGGVGPERTAMAEMIGTSGSYTAMTTRSGTEELLYMIDDRSEQLLIYRVRGTNTVDLVERQDLRQMFTAARAAWLGAQPGRVRP